MSLIAQMLQLTDFQRIPVTYKPKTDVTHVTRIEKVTSVTSKKQAHVIREYWYSDSYTTCAMSDMSFQTF